jgi:WD40 repeat protein/serine/threonine protein kinase
MQKKIGNYSILKQIGTGGFGEVYLARQEVINRDVAMKVILPTHANQPEFIQRFQQEAEIIAKLENPHIVPLYDYWRDPDGAYLVMRYIRGGNLADKLTTHGAMEMEAAAKLLEQIAEALYVAHRNRVIHQDIKPANILLDDDGNAYLTDFGIARDLEGNINLAEDASNTMHGSPKYISPEHLRRKEITYRSDIYSLGLVMYEVLTGSPPYEGQQLLELLQHHVRTPLPSLQEKAPHLPIELNQPIIQASVKDPLGRYENVLKFAQDFRKAVNNVVYQGSSSAKGVFAPGKVYELSEDTGRLDVFKPYKGLAAFQESDSHEFYGRDGLVDELIKRMVEKGEFSRFLAVVGSSGSGKSSLVRAGLIPALRKGEIVGFPQYFSTMVPTANPMRSLEGAILKVAKSFPSELMSSLEKGEYQLNKMLELALPKDGEMLLFIDQFEEVFTLVESEAERRRFLNVIYEALTAENSKLRVIIAMRADFLDRPLSYQGWGNMVRERTEIVPPLKPAELRETIEKPAEKAHLILDEGLTDMIMEDMSQQAGALPLLQYTLSQLYEKREGLMLTTKAFLEMGKISGALAKRAEEIYQGLREDEQEVAKIVFTRLVRVGSQSRTRQHVLLSEVFTLDSANPAIREMVNIYGEQRLLTFDYDAITRFPTLELAHEALIGSWETLKKWLDENEGALRIQDRLSSDSKQWQEQEKDSSFLASGTRLAQYNEIENHPIISLTKREMDFLHSSNVAEEARLLAEKRRQRQIKALAVSMGIFGIVATILAFVSFSLMDTAVKAANAEATAHQEAVQSAEIARVRQLAAESLVNVANAPDTAMLLGLESLALGDSYEGRNALLTALESDRRLKAFYNGHETSLRAVTVSDDGTRVVSASRDGVLIIWDAASHEVLSRLVAHLVQVNALDMQGDTIASADNSGRIIIWHNEEIIQELSMGDNQISTLAFSPDGNYLAAANATGQIQIWSSEDYSPLHTIEAHDGQLIFSLVFAPDSLSFATGGADSMVRLWDIEGNAINQLVGHSDAVTSLAYSPDGRFIASGSADRSVGLWNALTAENIQFVTSSHTNRVTSMVFTDDSNVLISGDLDARIVLWTLSTGRTANFFTVGHSEVRSIATKLNQLYIAGDGLALLEYNIGIVPQLGESIANLTDEVELVSVVGSNSEVVYAGGGDFQIYRQPLGGEATSLAFHSQLVTGLAYHGENLISSSVDRQAVIWGASEPLSINEVEDSIFALAVFGDTVALGLNRGTIQLWSITGNEWLLLGTLSGHSNRVADLAFSPDGTTLVSASRDQSLIVWDVASQSQLFTLTGHEDAVEAVAFSPDGTVIASGSRDFTIRLWNAETGEIIGSPLAAHDNWVMSLAFSPDGKLLASSSRDSAVMLWSFPEARPLGMGFFGHRSTSSANAIAFSPDGSSLYSVGNDGAVFAWDTSLEKWQADACAIVNRGLRPNEISQFFSSSFPPSGVCEG